MVEAKLVTVIQSDSEGRGFATEIVRNTELGVQYPVRTMALSSYIHLLLSDIDLHIHAQELPHLSQGFHRR